MSNDNVNQPESTQAAQELQGTTKRLNDVLGLLRAQREILRKRGVNLPSGALEDLRTLKQRMDVLSKSVTDSHVELRSLRALAETTALINSSLNTHEVLNQVMDTVISLTGAERGYIVLKNRSSGELEFRVARGMEQSTLDESQGMIISKTIVNQVADTGEPELTDNASMDERYQSQESIVNFQLRSILAVPLKVRDEVIGVVYCDNRFMSGLFKNTELEVLTAFAGQAAVAIENARLFESVQRRLNEVTEIRDRVDNLFNSIASGVITIDNNHTVLTSNSAAANIFGRLDMVGKPLREALPFLDEVCTSQVGDVQRTGEQRSWECVPTLEDGKPRHLAFVASPLRDASGTQGVAIVIDDLTQRKQREKQLMEVQVYLPPAFADVTPSDITIEEREITALFADVRGFTSFSENLEPEELMTIINKYLSLASDAISLFEGLVDKYMGDAVTGLWNTQLNPQDDHPVRAIQAALQLVLDLHAQHEVLPEDHRLFYGIGIHTGPAVLGNLGGKTRQEFAALGEATDVCKYLQEQAGPGEIIISEQTLQYVEAVYDCVPVTELNRPKAGYEHIKCYRVVKRKQGTVAPTLFESPFIDDELRALLAADEEL
jgi:PAS domain S-box-containing protein